MNIVNFLKGGSQIFVFGVIVAVLLTSAVGVMSGYESGGGCIAYLKANPDTIPADGVSTSTIEFKITCPGKSNISVVPNIGTLKLDTKIFQEDKPMKATYTAPNPHELGTNRKVTITIAHRDSGESKGITISLINETEYCKDQCRKRALPSDINKEKLTGEFDYDENGEIKRDSEGNPICDCFCEKGFELRAEGCVPCEEICQEMDPRAHYDSKKSKPNDCECYCEGRLLEFEWGTETGKCECVTGAEPVGNECRCKKGFKPSADGKKCIPCESEESEKLIDQQKALKDLLEQRIKETTDEREKKILMEMLNNLMDVPTHKETILGGWNGVANVIHSILNKGERPSIGDLISIYKLKNISDIKKWFEAGLKTPKKLVWESKTLEVPSINDIDTAIEELKKGEHRTVSIKYKVGNKYLGYEDKETQITVVKGPDGTITYTLDGLNYFDGRDLDNKLNPGLWQGVTDIIDDLRRFALGTKYSDPDRKVIQYLANHVQREYNANVELNKKRSAQLKKQMDEKAFNTLVDHMKKFTGHGTTTDFIRYSLTETGMQAIEADFSNAAIQYVEAREKGRTQGWIKNNMNEQLFTGIGWKVADDFKVNENEQILLDQLEKVYQRYKIYKIYRK